MSYRYLCFASLITAGVLVLSGCSWRSSGTDHPAHSAATAPRPSSACQWNPASCMYKGSYEPGEDVYAEQEAARLNRAQAARLSGRLY